MVGSATKDFEAKIIRREFKDSELLRVQLKSDDMVLVACNNSRIPSVMITNDKISNAGESQKIEFETISFEDYEGYRIWCCEIVDDEIRVCLVK